MAPWPALAAVCSVKSSSKQGSLCRCPTCERFYHYNCLSRGLSAVPSALVVEEECTGCRVRGERCYNESDAFSPAQLPSTMVAWRGRIVPYLPVLPEAVHEVPVRESAGTNKLQATDRTARFSHIMVQPMIERDVSNGTLVRQMQCK